MSHVYNADFYAYINAGSTRSARVVTPILKDAVAPSSVLDVGCGQGAWLSVWREIGVAEAVGVDGDYVNREHLLIPAENFSPANLAEGFDLGRRFDLAQSLEVAEHLPPEKSQAFVKALCAHADMVMFSAAQPGQGGENHINERPLEDWRGFFASEGYVAVDFVRPAIKDEAGVEPWYRYNTVLYVKASKLETLPARVRAAALSDEARLDPGGSIAWRIRRTVFSVLPHSLATSLAKANAAFRARMAQRAAS